MTREQFVDLALSSLDEVTAYARRISRTDWDGDDLVQSAFEHAFRRWRDLRDAAHCRAWLFRITRNLHIDRRRRAAARVDLRLVGADDPTTIEVSVSPETVERLTARELDHALGMMPEEQRDSILLCDLWGFPYEEIAQIMAVPVGTVRSRISRGRAALMTILVAGRVRDSGSRREP